MSQIPRYGQSFLLPNGSIAPVWYDYLRTLDASSLTAEIERQVQANTEAIKALQQAGFGDYLPAGAFVLGVNSVETFGELKDGTRVILRGDVALPDPTTYYGADQDQERGFHPISGAIEAEAGELTKDVGEDGVTTFGLADVTPDTGGNLQRYGFDAKGRRVEEGEATTDDLTEGENNLYFTEERARFAAVTDAIDPLATDTAPSGRAVSEAIDDIDLTGYAELGSENIFSELNRFDSGAVFGKMLKVESIELAPGLSFGSISPTEENAIGIMIAVDPESGPSLNMLGGALTLTGPGSVNVNGDTSVAFVSRNRITFYAQGGDTWFRSSTLRPFFDGASASGGTLLGEPAYRWSEVFSVNGTINTSDAREKSAPRDLSPAELSASCAMARLPCVFQWLHAIEEKGEGARLHAGPTVQDVIAVMQENGLDPFRYGFVCYDEWEELPEIRDEETGEILQEHLPAGDRYSLRPTELAHFVMRGLAHRQDELERRLAALESE